jgi:hypothetical protein
MSTCGKADARAENATYYLSAQMGYRRREVSYSMCINCEQMVPCYEKYCVRCLKKYPQLKQTEDFWKNYHYTWEVAKRIAKDEIGGSR